MRRHRVRLRPRARRRRRPGALLLLAAVGAWGLWTRGPLREWLGRLRAPRLGEMLPSAARVDSLSVWGAPDAMRGAVVSATGWVPGQRWAPGRAGEIERGLARRFGCFESVRVRRAWSERSARVEVRMRMPVARATRPGWSGYLDGSGAIFEAPPGVFGPLTLPTVELGGFSGDGAAELARVVRSGALPGRLERLRYEGEDGWVAELEGGTRLEWGALQWTDQKLARLAEVFRDAGGRFGGAASADLRQFEEGKIFVLPRR